MGPIEFSFTWDFVVRFLSITLIDLALSGDNAIVIGMAAASLPKGQRKFAIIAGAGLAILLRVALTAIASWLMKSIPFLMAIGGAVLFWVAWRLLRIDTDEHEEGEDGKVKISKNFRQAIILIVTADFMMSLDNVIAVAGSAGTSENSTLLIILGLIISMPLLMGTGGAISLLIDKFKWLIYLGAAVIMFTATRMILEDKEIEEFLKIDGLFIILIAIAVGILMTWLFYWLNKRRTLNKPAKKQELKGPSREDVPEK
jgi:YjbE family integral membrane protein